MFRKTTLLGLIVATVTCLGLALPVVPAAAALTQTIAAPAGSGAVPPPSAYGCNANVCIGIDGSGTTVVDIYAQVQNPYSHSVMTTGTITDNGTVIHTFPAINLGVGGTDTQTWGSPSFKFKSGDKVCAHYSGISGVPCETIG
jgi:hypothetical protein